MDAAIAGLIGAAIGAGVSLGGLWIQAHYTTKREKSKLIIDSAIAARGQDITLVTSRSSNKAVPPVAAYINHHQKISDLLANGELNSGKAIEIFAQYRLECIALTDLDSEWTIESTLKEKAKI